MAEGLSPVALRNIILNPSVAEESPECAAARRAAMYNSQPGDLEGPDCPECLNRGNIAVVQGIYVVFRQCGCMGVRRSLKAIEKSGLKDSLAFYDFENFHTPELWQKEARAAAEDFAKNKMGWFLMAGAVGCGKTHLCTAICKKLLEEGVPVRYMRWRDDSVRLKASVNEPDYQGMIAPWKKAKALYIDDLFKGGGVTAGDINLAFEILNARYLSKELITIISTEKTVEDLLGVDEAIGSRIYERSKGHYVKVAGKGKNWRLRADTH